MTDGKVISFKKKCISQQIQSSICDDFLFIFASSCILLAGPPSDLLQPQEVHCHAPRTSALEACLRCLCPWHPAPETRSSKPSLEARSPRPDPRAATVSRAHILAPESRCDSHTDTPHEHYFRSVAKTLWTPEFMRSWRKKTASRLQRHVGNVVDSVSACQSAAVSDEISAHTHVQILNSN